MSSDKGTSEVAATSPPARELTSDGKSVLRFITWNTDGLHQKNLIPRAEAVCKTVLNAQADIIFLQEIVPKSAEYFEKHLPDYKCVFGNKHGYFVGTFLKKCTVSYKGSKIIDFPTRMARNCLKVNVAFKDKNLVLFNSHLESLIEGADERKMQLKKIFKEMLASSDSSTAIFGGDFNSRDKELEELGGLPAGIDDIWRECGSQKDSEFTFDLTQNDNLANDMELGKPRCRFDRIYVRHSSPRQFKPSYFGLIGLARLQPQLCFPSDHWGILSHFEVE